MVFRSILRSVLSCLISITFMYGVCVPEFYIPLRVPAFTSKEVDRAVAKLPSGKAPGPDHVPNEMIKLAYSKFPAVFRKAL